MKPSQLLEQRAIEQKIHYPAMKMSEFLEKNNGRYLDDIALKYYGNNINYEQLFKAIDSYSIAFKSYGIKEGDFISVCLPTIPEAVAIMYALNKIGAIYHTILPMASTEQIVEVLKANNSKMFIAYDGLYYRVGDAILKSDIPFKVKVSANTSLPLGIKQLKYLSDILKKNTYKDIPNDFITTKELLKKGKGEEVSQVAWAKDSVAVVSNSSGSTLSTNKATMLADYGMNAMVENYKIALPEVHRGQTFHSTIPMFYSTGISNSVNLPLQLGLPTILEPEFNHVTYPNSFMKHKPNLSIVPPPHAKSLLNYLRKLYESGNKNRSLLSFVDVFSVGGATLPIPWEEELEFYLDFFGSSTAVGKGYGLSEHNSALTVSTKGMIGAAGIVLPGVIMGVFDPITGEELDFGQEGEIRAISPSDMVAYFNDPDLTEKYFNIDQFGRRWGHTEDIGKLELINGDVWLFYSGRKKDIVNINNKDILLSKTVAKLFECEFIDDCAIVMLENEGTSVPVAHIVLKNDFTSQEEVLRSLEGKFDDDSLSEPYAYKIHEILPVLISGKADKHTLAKENNGYVKLEGNELKSLDFSFKTLQKTIN